ncbi:glycosyltransferase family 31 protein [Saccharata proteae CBS 121410]|uniref:Glycosyltransferase family 31 protein n=1 Tax=Saccharata proteae CBS 121410 TaxID=1314787 RepID=A0A9P4HQK6_9PEZI|nr:glycosyltransferase family 31 protein [Saccharata proteae CBS 121410]
MEASKQQETLPCRNLPGADEILLSLKTGATEAHQKLPVHFKTTLRCAPHYVLFSDLEESIQGELVHDALDEIDEDIKNTHPDFQLYHQMRHWHAAGKEKKDLPKESLSKEAWDLDKWKFLPIAEKALKMRPQAKWFVFTEADTHVVWPNLLQWLAQLDPEKPYYMGSQNWIGSTEFAHGGAGYIVSHVALERVVEEYTSKRSFYHELTASEWAGDAILAKAFINAGIPVTRAWPISQGESPSSLDYTARHWCFPVVSYHHIVPTEIKTMFEYEQKWLARYPRNDVPIHHHEAFAEFVAPKTSLTVLADWDNLADDEEAYEEPENATFETCRDTCINKPECLQWTYYPGKCKTAGEIRLGRKVPFHIGAVSGWMPDRVQNFIEGVGTCNQGWILE